MSEYLTRLSWERRTPDFVYETYDRGHAIVFGGGTALAASAAPEFRGEAGRVNPEELYVASLSSCHMLSFLAIAARKRLVVDAYRDEAVGRLTPNAVGHSFVSHVTLRPRITFANPQPIALVRAMHHQAHAECFIANSVLTVVTVET